MALNSIHALLTIRNAQALSATSLRAIIEDVSIENGVKILLHHDREWGTSSLKALHCYWDAPVALTTAQWSPNSHALA